MSLVLSRRALLAVAIPVAVGFGFAGIAKAEQFINILTGGTSGAYYPIGVGLSKIYADEISDVRPSVQSTKASVENLNLLQQGKGEVALTLGDSLSFAWEGNEEVGFKQKLDKLRGVASMYPNYVQIVASKESGIKTLADLKGKRISVGAPKSGTELNARAIFGAGGLSYDDFAKTEYLPFGESVELIKNRQLDATLLSVGLGGAAIRDLAAAIPITMVEVPEEVVKKVGNAAYVPGVIPANTYSGQESDVKTAAILNFLVTRSDLSDELVYEMTKAMFENIDQLYAAHGAAKEVTLDTALEGMPVPLHPGARKYYEEKGKEVPAALVQ